MNATENNLWVHGDLAKRYIERIEDEIMNLHEDDSESKENLTQKIDMISEPMIKKILQSNLNYKLMRMEKEKCKD